MYKATKSFQYSNDGTSVVSAKKDDIVDITDETMAQSFLDDGSVVEASEDEVKLSKDLPQGDPNVNTPEKLSALTERDVAKADAVAHEEAARKDLEDAMIGRKVPSAEGEEPAAAQNKAEGDIAKAKADARSASPSTSESKANKAPENK